MRNWDHSFLKQAHDIARKVKAVAGSRHGAILASRRTLISVGWNHYKTSPFYAKYGWNDMALCAHAETHAIYQANKQGFSDWTKATLYVARYVKHRKDGLGNSCPCRGCMDAIIDFGIKKVVYTDPDVDGGFNVLTR